MLLLHITHHLVIRKSFNSENDIQQSKMKKLLEIEVYTEENYSKQIIRNKLISKLFLNCMIWDFVVVRFCRRQVLLRLSLKEIYVIIFSCKNYICKK